MYECSWVGLVVMYVDVEYVNIVKEFVSDFYKVCYDCECGN